MSARGNEAPIGNARRRGAALAAPRRWVAVVLAGTHFLTGCYTYVPASVQPSPGAEVAFDISDAGRVALAERLGPGVTRVEGRVTDATTDEYAMRVSALSQINSGRVRWSGESVRLRREYVVRSEQRKFSRGRTALAVGGAVLGLVAAILTRSLVTGGGPDYTPPGGGPPGET